MKRFLVFILLGPVLFVLCIWALFLPAASLTEGAAVRFNIEVDFRALLLGVMFGGFVLALLDWLAEMLVMRPWFTGARRVGIGRADHRSVVRPVSADLVVVHRQRAAGGHPGFGLLLAGQKNAKWEGSTARLIKALPFIASVH